MSVYITITKSIGDKLVNEYYQYKEYLKLVQCIRKAWNYLEFYGSYLTGINRSVYKFDNNPKNLCSITNKELWGWK